MLQEETRVRQFLLTGLLLGVVALVGAACGGGEESAAGVASVADVEAAVVSEPDPDEGAPTAVEADDDAVGQSADVPSDESGTDERGDDEVEAETTIEEAADEAELTDEDMALAFVACVREAGIDEMPDPTVSADGTVQLIPPGPERQLLADPDFEEAAEGCIDLIEDATFYSAAPDISAIEDSLLEFAKCLRENGVEVDDPDLSKFVPGEGFRMFGDEFDPQDPASADAVAACSSLLPNAAGS